MPIPVVIQSVQKEAIPNIRANNVVEIVGEFEDGYQMLPKENYAIIFKEKLIDSFRCNSVKQIYNLFRDLELNLMNADINKDSIPAMNIRYEEIIEMLNCYHTEYEVSKVIY